MPHVLNHGVAKIGFTFTENLDSYFDLYTTYLMYTIDADCIPYLDKNDSGIFFKTERPFYIARPSINRTL